MKVKRITVEGVEALENMCYTLIDLSVWFEIMPFPGDMWEVSVKPDAPIVNDNWHDGTTTA